MPLAAAIYTRISSDPEGLRAGVMRQREDCEALAARLGWTVAEIYEDNDLSGYKEAVRRPAMERMLRDCEAGRRDAIITLSCDRIDRRLVRLAAFLDWREKHDIPFATTEGDDTTTANGRMMVEIKGAFAQGEAAKISERVKRSSLALAIAGKPNGGGYRAYGWKSCGANERGAMELEPAEAAIVREAAGRVLAGESPISICRELDQRGVPRPGRSKMWEPSVLKALLIRPRMAGLRQHQGAIMLTDSGEPVRATWEPILDMETWEALRALLTDPEREIGRGKADRKYLLSGIVRCQCGAKMYGVHKKGKAHYMCPTYRGCGKTCRVGGPIDDHIAELVLRYLEREQTEPEAMPDDDPLDAQIKEAETSLANLIAEWGAGRVSDTVFFSAQAKREGALRGLKAQRATVRRRRSLKAPTGPAVREIWRDANISQRRAMVQDVLVAVKVKPKPPGRTPFRAQYYEPVWRPESE